MILFSSRANWGTTSDGVLVNAYYQVEVSHKKESEGKTQVTWILWGKGRTSSPTWFQNSYQLKITSPSQAAPHVDKSQAFNAYDPKYTANEPYVSFNQNKGYKRAEGSFYLYNHEEIKLSVSLTCSIYNSGIKDVRNAEVTIPANQSLRPVTIWWSLDDSTPSNEVCTCGIFSVYDSTTNTAIATSVKQFSKDLRVGQQFYVKVEPSSGYTTTKDYKSSFDFVVEDKLDAQYRINFSKEYKVTYKGTYDSKPPLDLPPSYSVGAPAWHSSAYPKYYYYTGSSGISPIWSPPSPRYEEEILRTIKGGTFYGWLVTIDGKSDLVVSDNFYLEKKDATVQPVYKLNELRIQYYPTPEYLEPVAVQTEYYLGTFKLLMPRDINWEVLGYTVNNHYYTDSNNRELDIYDYDGSIQTWSPQNFAERYGDGNLNDAEVVTVKLYGVWDPKTYLIRVLDRNGPYTNGWTQRSIKSGDKGDDFKWLTLCTSKGYDYLGLYDEQGTQVWDANGDPSTGNATYWDTEGRWAYTGSSSTIVVRANWMVPSNVKIESRDNKIVPYVYNNATWKGVPTFVYINNQWEQV